MDPKVRLKGMEIRKSKPEALDLKSQPENPEILKFEPLNEIAKVQSRSPNVKKVAERRSKVNFNN